MKQYSYQTVDRTMLGDLHTPVNIYPKVRDISPQSVLMESPDYHGSEDSRSFIGLCPVADFSIDHGISVLRLPGGTREERPTTEEYYVENVLHDFLNRFHVKGEYSSYYGLHGYTLFNAVRYSKNIAVKDSRKATNDAPDVLYILYKYLIIFNGFKNEMPLLETLAPDEKSELDKVQRAIHNRNYTTYGSRAVGETTSPLTDEEHRANIRWGIAHRLRGDVSQIVLSRRFGQRFVGDDSKLYRVSRSINPSPCLFYFDFGGFRTFGSSPETHCCIEGTHAHIDSIAGTIKCIDNPEQDAVSARHLHDNPRESAEYVMLVDLVHNDLGRNCHDVKVDSYKGIQYYSYIIRLVSRVSGTLNNDADPIKTLIDTFPAGTLSGVPKVRAMQFISELETYNRGAYGGCIGFIGLNESLNQAITIRTFVNRNGVLWFQADGGIVTQSNDEYELQEADNKLGALKEVIIMAEKMQRTSKQ